MTDLEENQQRPPSRSARKRAAQAVEELAHKLSELPPATFAALPLTPHLRKEAEAVRAIRSHGARKRQVKHLAGLLREEPEQQEEVLAFLGGVSERQLQKQEEFHLLEALRDRLCHEEDHTAALEECVRRFPSLDEHRTRKLAQSARTHGDKQAARALFRLLRQAMEEDGGTQPEP